MILHITFTDGSNPWISFAHDRHTIIKQWRQWVKHHPETAKPKAISGNYECSPGRVHGFYVYNRTKTEPETAKYYDYLGHALRALERLGGGKQ